MTSEPLNQYTEICRDAIKSLSAKLSKTFENLLLEILLLYMTIQRKINFTQWSLGEVECCGLPCELTSRPMVSFTIMRGYHLLYAVSFFSFLF